MPSNSKHSIQAYIRNNLCSCWDFGMFPLYKQALMNFRKHDEPWTVEYRLQREGRDELIEWLLDSADFTKFTPEERVKYQYDMTTERDRRNQEAFKVNKAREEGRQERNSEIAKSMLAKGYAAEDIADITGLSIDEIEKLR